MITREAIIKAYCKIREIDSSIPDDVLDFMKDASIKSLEAQLSNTEQLTCETCKHRNECEINESSVHYLSWKFERQCEDSEFGCIYHELKDQQ